MRSGLKKLTKACLFTILLSILFGIAGGVFQRKSIRGFYYEPRDTIETIFLGPSLMFNGIVPTELYDEYGICSYNLATSCQPVLASYYWLREAYRLHEKTLTTVVVEPSMLRRETVIERYQSALDYMQFSTNKLEAVYAYTAGCNSFFDHLSSFFGYHERWTELERDDFKTTGKRVYSRGYEPILKQYMDSGDYSDLQIPTYYTDTQAEARILNAEALYYFKKIVEFCEDHHINLVLLKTPTVGGEDSLHNAYADLAEEYDLVFLDFNYKPLLNELDYEFPLDQINSHMNYYGAHKLTHWIGQYLVEQCNNRDVRGDERYSFMEDESQAFKEAVQYSASLAKKTSINDYIAEASAFDHCILLLSVKDEASNALTEEMRNEFAQAGLVKLSEIGYQDSYLAVIEDGRVVVEMTADGQSKGEALSYTGQTPDKESYCIQSAGKKHGNASSIVINGAEYSKKTRGINVVAYDFQNKSVIDAFCFDTSTSASQGAKYPEQEIREARENGTPYYKLSKRAKKAWLYDRRYENSKYESYWNLYCTEHQLFEYLSPYIENVDYTIYISAQDDAAKTFDNTVRSVFRELELTELAELQVGDSYIGVINDGKAYFEERDHGDSPIAYEGIDLRIVSGGRESGNCSEIMIHGYDYSLHKRGLNIVVYDKELRTVVSQITFDTCDTPINLTAKGGKTA